ncbi:hypothetical protein ACFVZH_39675 [Streptomyces sp. NPDC059534]|uniref:hypothetical protein n=1 Tax=Streptomyces sp. NPDC059534 TaxID=3346859 RepID=UPI0036B52636
MNATIDRLVSIAAVPITDAERSAIKDLAETRNALTHYGHYANAYAVEVRAVRALGFLIDFTIKHLHPSLSREAHHVAETMENLRGQLRNIEALVKDRMKQLSGDLSLLADRTVICPDCRQWAFVVGGEVPSCRFCLQEWENPFDAAFNFVVTTGEEEYQLNNCRACDGEETLVLGISVAQEKETDIGICFNCAEVYTRKAG